MVNDADLILVVHEEEARFFVPLEEAVKVLGVLPSSLMTGVKQWLWMNDSHLARGSPVRI